MRSEDTAFSGGPLDGRVLPVLCGMTGHPPKTYTVPVPGPDGAPETVYVYRRVMTPGPQRLRATRWRYEYDPDGPRPGLRWPWSRPARPASPPGAEPGTDGDGTASSGGS